MKLLALLLMCASLHATPPDCDVSKLLICIAQKEGQAQDAIGPHGERSIWGITKAVWNDHMDTKDEYAMGFAVCTESPFWARRVAIKHINWLAHELSKAGYAPSAYCIAAAWHLGLAGYVKLAKAGGESQYGKDVLAIYNSP